MTHLTNIRFKELLDDIRIYIIEEHLNDLDRWILSMTCTSYLSLKPPPYDEDRNFLPLGYSYLLSHAAIDGHIHIVNILLKKNSLTKDLMVDAIFGGNLKMISHLESLGCPCSTRLRITATIFKDDLDLFKRMWEMYSKGLDRITGSSFTYTDKGGVYYALGRCCHHPIPALEYLKGVDDSFKQGIKSAAHGAAYSGNISVLEWIKEKGGKGCCIPEKVERTDRPLLLKFVYALPSEAFCGAAQAGRINVLEYLLRSGCAWHDEACGYAALGGTLETLQWLRARGCPWGSGVIQLAMNSDVTGGVRQNIITWAKQNGCPD
jgi:hypothetical protein